MATDILIKRSTTTGAVPTTSDLSTGELAINTVDKRLFTNNSGTIVEIGTAPTSLAVTNNTTVGGTLGVTGNTTLSTVSTSGAATLASGSVTGNFSVAGTLTVATPSNSTDAASKGYVDTAVANVIDSAPGALDTLNELAAAINDDASFATTITNALAGKLALAGGTMTGDITLGANKITSTATPATDDTLTRKGYVDSILGSATSAATSAAAAATSETNAANSASAASTSASNASTSATNAATSATNASTSETNASTSATAAASSATSASNSASAAATSATNAYTSETNASTSETNAATSETNAATSATNASNSATSASTSATNASNSATSAATSATNAATSETNAASSASSASTSATSAASSASSAASAQTAAESARDSALAAYDNFDDRYLGAKSSDPTVDNDGDALVAGALYFNTTDESMKLYTGSAWVAAYASGSGFLTDIVSDTTPQLGGNLDTNGNDITFGDNDKAIFGAGSDLQIYHDVGGNSFINESGSGSLFVQGENIRFRNTSGLGTYALFTNGGAVDLYYNNSAKLATTATGVDVTGTVTADDLALSDANPTIQMFETDVTDLSTNMVGVAGSLYIQTTNDAATALKNRIRVNHSTGDISFYEDTGTTPKFFWDASAESLGIGTSSPARTVHISSATPILKLQDSDSTGSAIVSFVEFSDSANAQAGYVGYGGSGSSDFSIRNNLSGGELALISNNSEAMRIDSSGNLLVSKASANTNTAGVEARADGLLAATKSGAKALNLNRLTNDGDIAVFQKDGTKVGAIGSSGTSTYLDGVGGLLYYVNNNEKMKISAAGNVGIGTSSPLRKLHVSNGGAEGYEFGPGEAANKNQTLHYNRSTSQYIENSNRASQHTWDVNTSEAMRIDSSGNVGIGTSSPNAKLMVSYGNNAPNSSGNMTNGSVFSNSGTLSALQVGSTSNYSYLNSAYSNNSGVGVDMRFYTGGGSERMRLDSSGNLRFNSGYGSVATAYGCRAWVNFNGTGTVAIRASGNVSSISDRGTGRYTVNFSTSMPNTNYATMTTGKMTSAVTNGGSVTSVDDGSSGVYTTSAVSIISIAVDGNEADTSIYSVAVFR